MAVLKRVAMRLMTSMAIATATITRRRAGIAPNRHIRLHSVIRIRSHFCLIYLPLFYQI